MSHFFTVPDRGVVDKRLVEFDKKVNVCQASIREIELALRLMDYSAQEEVLERHLSKLKLEFDTYRAPTEAEREEQRWEAARLRRELELRQKELAELLTVKQHDEALVLRQASEMVAALLADTDAQGQAEQQRQDASAGEDAAAPATPTTIITDEGITERLAVRRAILKEVQAALTLGAEQRLPLHPLRPRSCNFYFTLDADRSVLIRHTTVAPTEEAVAAAAKAHLAASKGGDVGDAATTPLPLDMMHVAVVPVCADEEKHLSVVPGAIGVVVTQPYASAHHGSGGGLAYRGPLNQLCEPESAVPHSKAEEEEARILGTVLAPLDIIPGTGTFPDGSTYTGLWSRGLCEDSAASVVFLNGDSFTGDVHEDVITGRGRRVYANGDVYEGEFALGLRHGQGKHQCAAAHGGAVYEGGFAKDHYDGYGSCIYPEDGVRYDGEWLAGQRCGQGKLTALDERGSYEGPWAADRKHGGGAVHFAVAGVRYDGKWKKGTRVGQASAFTVEDRKAADQFAAAGAIEN